MDSTSSAPTSSSMASSAGVGTALGIIGVWYLNTFVWPGKIPIEVATSVGGVCAGTTAVMWSIFKQLLHKTGIEV